MAVLLSCEEKQRPLEKNGGGRGEAGHGNHGDGVDQGAELIFVGVQLVNEEAESLFRVISNSKPLIASILNSDAGITVKNREVT